MRKDILRSLLAMALFTVALGLAYPLLITGIAQLTMNDQANGSKLEVNGHVVGSKLIGQEFSGERSVRYFHSRPSVTDYNPAGTFFSNLGPNSVDLKDALLANAQTYLKRETRFNPGLSLKDLPSDTFSSSASGVDPHISVRNAEIQSARVASRRGLTQQKVMKVVEANTDGRFLGLLGEPGVNVLKLNIALDREVSR